MTGIARRITDMDFGPDLGENGSFVSQSIHICQTKCCFQSFNLILV